MGASPQAASQPLSGVKLSTAARRPCGRTGGFAQPSAANAPVKAPHTRSRVQRPVSHGLDPPKGRAVRPVRSNGRLDRPLRGGFSSFHEASHCIGEPMNLSLDQARELIAETRRHGAKAKFKPLTVVVLDAGGHVLAAEREDRSSNMRFQVAFAKANGSLAFGMGSRELMAKAETFPSFIAGATAAIGGALIPVPGGVLIRQGGTDGGSIVGAIGVSGDNSDNDEAAAVAGIEAVGLIAQVD